MSADYLPTIIMPEVPDETLVPEEDQHPLGNIKAVIEDEVPTETDEKEMELTDEEEEVPQIEIKKKLDIKKVFKSKTAKAEKQEKLEKVLAEAKAINDANLEKAEEQRKTRKKIIKKKVPAVKFLVEEELMEEEQTEQQMEEYEYEEEEVAPAPAPYVKPVALYKTGPKKGQPKPKKVLTAKQFEALQSGRRKRAVTNKVRKAEENEVKGAIRVRKPNKEDVFAHPADLQKVMLDNIVAYDKQKKTLKEQRKAEKAIEETQKLKDNNLNKTIQRALNPNDADYWGDCFSITY